MQESGEMYLETIYILSFNNSEVHSVDVAREMSFSKPSVSRALKILKEGKYIEIDDNSHIFLTESGLKIAKTMYDRHQVLSKCLVHMGVSENIASRDACKIEHDISEETFDALKFYAKKHGITE
ncbi:MAG: metal-dependent transcriptional regulator [Treponemataceae bacterium]